MPRNYLLQGWGTGTEGGQARRLRPLGLATTALVAAAALQGQGARSEELFAAQPLEQNNFAILGRPVGREDWSLLVLEQLAATPSCWSSRPDGLVDPSLNRFNFSGICSRYIDSNGYSLRVGEQDLGGSHRLRLVQVGQELRLLASTVSSSRDLMVGRGTVPLRDRDGFVALTLEPGWTLQRRTYQGRTLSHIYFANSDSLPVLLARLLPEPPPIPSLASGRGSAPSRSERGSSGLLSRLNGIGSSRDSGNNNSSGTNSDGNSGRGSATSTGSSGTTVASSLTDRSLMAIPGRPIPLQVIPFSD